MQRTHFDDDAALRRAVDLRFTATVPADVRDGT
jgi:hypothetical protein